jgi:tetratricopeptide (TPR) repeat protein
MNNSSLRYTRFLMPEQKKQNSLQRLTKQAQNHSKAGRHEAAAKLWEKLAQREPQDVSLILRAVQSWRDADNDSHAMRVLESALQCQWSARDEAKIWEAVSDVHGANRRWDECVGAAQKALQLDARLHMAREMMASALLQNGRVVEASDVMRELLQMSPFDPLHRLRYATLLQLQGRGAEASQEFARVVQMHPDAPFSQEAREAMEAIDASQIQQILMQAAEAPHFRQALHREMETALQESGFYLSENGRESLRNILSDGRIEPETKAPRMH